MSRRGCVVFDRDGTLIDFYRDPDLGVVTPAFHPKHVRFRPGALEAMRALSGAGYALAMATNQPGAAKGEVRRKAIGETMAHIIERLAEEGVPLATFQVCLHHPEGGEGGEESLAVVCECRKPKPGMLLKIARDLDLHPAACWMVGDTPTDVLAARAAGMRAALLARLDRCELCPLAGADGAGALATSPPDILAPALQEIASRILASS